MTVVFSPPPNQMSPVQPDFVPADGYYSKEFLALENERMWPRVWQVACREEEIRRVGDFVTYDIVNDSIIVVRTSETRIQAYHNVCAHRGRRLTKGCGRTGRFHCPFHGWKWNLDGSNAEVVDHQDWGDALKSEDLRLKSVHVDTWGGYVFINMDADPVPLRTYLGAAADILDPFQIEKMRYRWHRAITLGCNWKVALEAFNEGYHVQTTHRQLLAYSDDMTYSKTYGRHSMFGSPPTIRMRGSGSPRVGSPRQDYVNGIVEYLEELYETLNAQVTRAEVDASKRLPDMVGPTATPQEVGAALQTIFRDVAREQGWEWPEITGEQIALAGSDWHVFPNMIVLPRPSAVLGYRVRPHASDPDICYFEVYALERFAPGAEPPHVVEHSDDPSDEQFWGLILKQDFDNMVEVQQGMKSRAFNGARTNPVQEQPVSNFHRALYQYLAGDESI